MFDELHKYRRWRNFLKGVYDEVHEQRRILATGSARLDLYRFGGDSLQGRYHCLRLHPLSAGARVRSAQRTRESASGIPALLIRAKSESVVRIPTSWPRA